MFGGCCALGGRRLHGLKGCDGGGFRLRFVGEEREDQASHSLKLPLIIFDNLITRTRIM